MKTYIHIVFLLISSISIAQEIKKDTIKLNEVIIEVSKSTTKLQKTPMAISQISSKKIEKLGVNSLSDLNAIVPNLFMPDYGSRSTAPIYIRGIGSRGDDPSVGLYVDDIPFFDKGTFNFEFQNIKKIEVLRGPQGTLYGRNTMGGLIRVYTPSPKFKTGASIKVDYGTNNYFKPSVHYNQKVTDKLAFLVDASLMQTDGFFTNKFSGKNVDEAKSNSLRFKLKYNPLDNLTLNFITNYGNNKQNGFPYGLYDSEKDEVAQVNYNQPSSYDRDLLSIGLNAKYNTSIFDVNFSTSFQKMEDLNLIDQDFSTANLYFVDQWREKNTFVEELNINSKKESKLKWIGGLFAFQTTSDKIVDVDLNIPNRPYMNIYKTYDINTNGIAGFGQIEIPLNKFNFTLGLRYDYETATMIHNYERAVGEGSLNHVSDLDLSLEYGELLPKFIINYNSSETVNLYTSFSKGYKAGGFNSTIERDEDETFNSEYSYNYEFGAKTQWFDKKLTANASIFYIDWKDQQVRQIVPSGRGVVLKNAGKSVSKGADLELSYIPNKRFDFGLGYGYTDAKFVSYKDKDKDGNVLNFDDNYISLIPKYTLSSSANYHLLFENKKLKEVVFNTSYKHFGGLYWERENTNYQKSYGLLNANISAQFDKFSFGVYGKNVLDIKYNSYLFTKFAQLGTPQRVGVFFKYKF